MKENLSALMDGEGAGEDLAAVTARVKDDAGLRRAWDTWHLIGDALRGHAGPHLAARVSRRLAEEPAVLALSARPTPGRIAWYAMSAAAGLAAIVLVAWTALPLVPPQEQTAGGSAADAPFVPVAASAPAPAAESQARAATAEVQDYLLAHQPYSHASAMQGVAGWVIRSAPPGFRTVSEMTRTVGGTTGVGHIVLSDGLAVISVFIEPMKPSAPPPGLVRQGAVNIYMRQLGDRWITAVGEAPPDSVKYVADAVELRK